MANRTDREAMAAALGGMVSRQAPDREAPDDREPAPTQSPEEGRGVGPIASVAPVTPSVPEASDDEGYRRTGTGYVKADGTQMVRTVVMVTGAERQRLKAMALEAGLSPSDYVRRALGFLNG